MSYPPIHSSDDSPILDSQIKKDSAKQKIAQQEGGSQPSLLVMVAPEYASSGLLASKAESCTMRQEGQSEHMQQCEASGSTGMCATAALPLSRQQPNGSTSVRQWLEAMEIPELQGSAAEAGGGGATNARNRTRYIRSYRAAKRCRISDDYVSRGTCADGIMGEV
jgi:hypothetical protein